MANHKSAVKRIRSNNAKSIRNKYWLKTCRTSIKKLKKVKDKKEAQSLLKITVSMLDKLAKKRIIHKNKASNIKSSISKFVNVI
ncbi:MAG: 30S ribosomal protein S20 [Bacteroidetes bacterium]|nr:30S ribosomal protein S20 [Bacteroidota bacterium]